jgi:hypothetical protein
MDAGPDFTETVTGRETEDLGGVIVKVVPKDLDGIVVCLEIV